MNLLQDSTLKNWTVKIKGHPAGENYKNTFRLENGVLKVNYDLYESFNDAFGHIFYNQEFSNYKLRLQYQFTGNQIEGGADWATRNSGVMIHCENPKNMGLNQNFPVCLEVQLLGGLSSGERPTGNLCTPGTDVVIDEKRVTDHCVNSSSETYNGNQWVTLEITVLNDSLITHKINGKTVMSYTKPQIGGGGVADSGRADYWEQQQGKSLKKGFISLQSESHPVAFRNIEILEL
ncbi:DUF1080 domain-containing protein [Tamlana sp. I1]|uniref:3-keto-disaccharide hydrolase n=1 Tax=Tamlana sp. I1 TaxID=2762061 RepID=UPI00188FFC00|nr:DUF1080 domain-containing protein [Tamlana sp. I1]